VHIPCLLFHTLPTLNRTFILRVSALFALRSLLYSWARLRREDTALCHAFGLKIHCIWGTNIALRFCLASSRVQSHWALSEALGNQALSLCA
jgi:hypothetical protein